MVLNLVFNLVAMTSVAQASEFFYQPPTEVGVLTAQTGYRNTEFQYDQKDVPNQSMWGLYRTGLKYDQSFNQKLSAGAELTYTDLALKSNGTKSSSGFEPLVLKFRGHEPVSTWSWLYAVDLTIGIDGAKETMIGSSNRTVGDFVDGVNRGLTLTPMVGIANNIGRSHHGILVGYDVYKMDTSFDIKNSKGETESAKDKKGNRSNLVAFYELHYDGFLIGADVNWIKQWENVRTFSTGDQTFSGFALLRGEVYANIATSKNGAILPTLTWNTTALWDAKENIDDFRGMIAFRQAL